MPESTRIPAEMDRAERPVVLVRASTGEGGPQPTRTAAGGAVVVALKLDGPCDDLLTFAFESAAVRGLPLRVVHGRSLPVAAYVPWGVNHDMAEGIVQDAQKPLSQTLRPWSDRFPQVDVTDSTPLVSPAKAVVRAAEGADPLVVGRRRHHRAPAPHLGPQAAIHHARCPVAVVPHD
ncbi:universal stress protein [Streptomyces sp. NPDC014724]|uniref:universal stress protein n=1 Tax=unclassified Streptomyces TaxID=2593676 RepID=UPI0036F961C3